MFSQLLRLLIFWMFDVVLICAICWRLLLRDISAYSAIVTVITCHRCYATGNFNYFLFFSILRYPYHSHQVNAFPVPVTSLPIVKFPVINTVPITVTVPFMIPILSILCHHKEKVSKVSFLPHRDFNKRFLRFITKIEWNITVLVLSHEGFRYLLPVSGFVRLVMKTQGYWKML